MTKAQIEQVLKRVFSWPASRQADAAQVLMVMENQQLDPYRLSDEERADIDEALAELARGEVASEMDVARTFDRNRK